MANFKGLIGLEQLSPEVLDFLQTFVDQAIRNSGGNPGGGDPGPTDPPVDVIIAQLKGVITTSPVRPEDYESDAWINPTDGSIPDKLVSSQITLAETPPAHSSPGDIFVKVEK